MGWSRDLMYLIVVAVTLIISSELAWWCLGVDFARYLIYLPFIHKCTFRIKIILFGLISNSFIWIR